MTDPYTTLGVSTSASEAVIRAAYRARMRETHPDVGGDPQDAQRVNDAHALLTDPARRSAFDAEQTLHAPEPTLPNAPVEPTYEKHAFPRRWWKTKLAWILVIPVLAISMVISFLVPGATNTPFGSVLLIAAALILGFLRKTLLALGAAVLPALLSAPVDGWALLPAAGVAVMLAVWAVARRREARQLRAHLRDVFATTSQRFDLPVYVIADIDRGLLHLDGNGEWPRPTARASGSESIGDRVLVHRGMVIAWMPAAM